MDGVQRQGVEGHAAGLGSRVVAADAVGVERLARLFGAALILVMFVAWRASQLTDPPSRRMVAGGLLVYTTLGAVISSWGQLAGNWNVLGWSTIISYLIFVLGYGYFLFLKPE